MTEHAVTDQQLSEYEALAAAATPGPWRLWRPGQPAEVIDTEEQSLGRIWQRVDAEFIVAARTAVQPLVAEIRALRSLVQDFLDPDPCSFDHHGHCQTHGWLAEGSCPHSKARQMLGALEPIPSEREAAATLASECTDHAEVILWCADRVRSVDDDPAVRDAADYLHGLSTRAQVDSTPVTDRAAVIRWCAQQIHSMGADGNVERAAEYLDDLAVEAQEAHDEAQAQANLDALADELAAGALQGESVPGSPRCAHCTHSKRDHDGRADHRAKSSPLVAGEPWCHACNTECDYAAAKASGCWCGHPKDRHWSGATNMTFPDGCHDCRGWNGAHAYSQELPWLPEGEETP